MFCLKMIRLRYCLIGVALIIENLVVLLGHFNARGFVSTEYCVQDR